MRLLLVPLLALALVAGAAWYAVEALLGGRPGFRRDEGLTGWALRTVSDLGEPAGQACAYYVDAGVRLSRVCDGPRGRVASRTALARP